MAWVKSVAKLSNCKSRNFLAAAGVRSSNTSSDDEGIFHNSSQNSASEEETSRLVRAARDSRNLIFEADAPILFYLQRIASISFVGLLEVCCLVAAAVAWLSYCCVRMNKYLVVVDGAFSHGRNKKDDVVVGVIFFIPCEIFSRFFLLIWAAWLGSHPTLRMVPTYLHIIILGE